MNVKALLSTAIIAPVVWFATAIGLNIFIQLYGISYEMSAWFSYAAFIGIVWAWHDAISHYLKRPGRKSRKFRLPACASFAYMGTSKRTHGDSR